MGIVPNSKRYFILKERFLLSQNMFGFILSYSKALVIISDIIVINYLLTILNLSLAFSNIIFVIFTS